jgi:ribosomal protein L11 methyltransferase
VLVVVATDPADADGAADHLRHRGAAEVTKTVVSSARVLVYGGPFDDRQALDVAADMRILGWPSDVCPEGGGHLAAWQTHTRPISVGTRLLVCFPWSECPRDQAELVVEIDPGRAFGTGAHPTTHLLLTELVTRLRGGETVLDVGCGSGVLSIAAARLGAAQVTAVDISPEAIAATKANAARNGVAKEVEAQATPVADLAAEFDVVVANIHAATLIELAPAIQRRLAPGAWLALSGLSPAQVSKVAAAYQAAAYQAAADQKVKVAAITSEDDWSAIVATRVCS